ncbi:Lysylphosphatidylglycerol synthase TM region [Filimonas lacunae]|uniref:Lysylphosphatidylglycerol synthase TM region n=1 Tax=Filimonas lacunae TaxID=477680 RepID=A0A1N7L2P4_9BACT|nr:lysylphosphatidylglycerol synthase domain-containing protein [Filimonas lacunae]SIS67930.1 Lysylphosphatidylglycerol synthase TM region [Filimonas lacunae]
MYKRIQNQANFHSSWDVIKQSFLGPKQWMFWVVMALSLVNWGIEARKWQVLVAPVQHITLWKAFKAVLSGLALSLFVPNRVGEYVGRILYMDEGNRLRSIALTLIGSVSQLIVTLVAGIGGLIYLRSYVLTEGRQLQGLSAFWFDGMLYAIIVGTVLLLLVYYKLSRITSIIERIPFVSKYSFFIQKVETFHWKELTNVLMLSVVRFVVFTAQYLLLMQVFEVHIGIIDGWWIICVMFLVLAIVPTIPIAELGVRGQASLQLFGLLSTNTIGIIATAAGIWGINLILPSLAGSLFILSIKLFRK